MRKVEADPLIGGKLYPHKKPLPEGVHPKIDESPLLDPEGVRTYQMLIGSAQWANTLTRLDICYAVSSLSHFSVNPKESHLEMALHLFGYLKKNPNRGVLMDYRPLLLDSEYLKQKTFHPDFFGGL